MRGLVVEPLRCPRDRLRAGDLGRAYNAGVGDAMGDGGAPRRAPALGSRESGNDDGGCGGMRWREGFGSGWGPALAGGRFANRPYDRGGAHEGGGDAGAAGGGGAPSCALRTGFDRLRANGFGKRACGGEWGMRWGTGTPRAAPLPWVPARAGTTMGGVVGCVGARGSGQGGGPLSRAGGSRTAPTTGEFAESRGYARGPPSCALRLRQAQGERVWEGRVRWGVGDAMGGVGGFCGGDRLRGPTVPLAAPGGRQQTLLGSALQKTPAVRWGVSTMRAQGAGRKPLSLGKLLGSEQAGATSGGGIRRLGRMWSPGPGRRPIRSPRWRRRGRGRCRR